MKITVKAKTNSSTNCIERIDECTLEVRVTATPEKGKANAAIIDLLSDYFHKPKSNITILAGHTNKNKIVEILD